MKTDQSFSRKLKSSLPPKLRSYLGVLKLRLKRATYRTKQVRHMYGGIPLVVELRDPDSAGWYDNDSELPREIEFLTQHRLRPGARVFEVGAHQGVVAMLLARIVEPGLVVAVEGNQFNAAAAQRNVELNGIKNARILHGVAAAQPGKISFSEGSNGHVAESTTFGFKVRSYSIDELSEIYGLPDVLFVDVEGYELEVLKGARKTLGTRPNCYVEVHTGCGLEKYGGSPGLICEFFREQDYDLYICEGKSRDFNLLKSRENLPTQPFLLMALGKAPAEAFHAADPLSTQKPI